MHVGLLDIVAAGALAVALILPGPSHPVRPLFGGEAAALAPRVAEAQARLVRDPADGDAAAQLADLLLRANQTDWAIRAGIRVATGKSPDRWRALVAVSAAHVDRFEIRQGLEWAMRALEACEEPGARCEDYERGRLSLYVTALRAAFDSHIDPRRNPAGITDAVNRAVPLIRLRGGK